MKFFQGELLNPIWRFHFPYCWMLEEMF